MDESGDIGLLKSRVKFYVVGYVYVDEPKRLQRHINNYLVKITDKELYPYQLEELKFHIPINRLENEFGYSTNETNTFVGIWI